MTAEAGIDWRHFGGVRSSQLPEDMTEAAAAYAEAHALDPEHEDALYYLGGVRRELGDYEGALESWSRLIEMNAKSGRALVSLGAGEGLGTDVPPAAAIEDAYSWLDDRLASSYPTHRF